MSQPKLLDIGDIAYMLYPSVSLEFLCTLGRLRGRLQYLLGRHDRATVRDNLQQVFGDQASPRQIEGMTRRYFEYQQLNRLPIMLAPVLSDADLAKLVHIEGIQHLDQALAQGKGVILLGSHVHSVFMFLAVVALRKQGYDIRVAMPTAHDAWARTRLRTLVDRRTGRKTLRELLGAFYAQFNIRPILQCFKEGAIVAQTGDGWHSAAFVEAPFLGHAAPFTTGMLRIAQMTGALVVPMFPDGEPPDRVRFILEEPISVPSEGHGRQAIEAAVAHYASRLEHYVLRNPPAWQHWEIPNTLEAMRSLPQRTLNERYQVA
ncbi:MAG TPA: lysophospholipid acyltransferase family protein [Chloroflexota bacterium]|nr:lysophospholipid acyltransferase family protein [Chloroflexota bacterium]